MSLQYYVIDTETTGLRHNYHEVNEISIIRCSDRIQLWKKIRCFYPERASFDALAITNKTIEDIQVGEHPKDIIAECNKFFLQDGLTPAHRCIIAHNANFDKKFLHSLWKSYNQTFPANLWLDTMSLTREYAKKIGLVKPKVNLQAACDMVGIKKLAGAHSAKVDSRNTYFLHKSLVEDKKIDYLPFIKTAAHILDSEEEEDS